MSAYKEIKTQFKAIESLLKALKDLGYQDTDIERSQDSKANTVSMVGFGYSAKTRDVAVRLKLKAKGAYEDVGFVYQDGIYQAVISTHDNGDNFGQAKLKTLTQRYAVNEAIRLAKREGHTAREITREEYKRKHGVYPADGSLCLEITARARR